MTVLSPHKVHFKKRVIVFNLKKYLLRTSLYLTQLIPGRLSLKQKQQSFAETALNFLFHLPPLQAEHLDLNWYFEKAIISRLRAASHSILQRTLFQIRHVVFNLKCFVSIKF